jgi:hypothetical protein
MRKKNNVLAKHTRQQVVPMNTENIEKRDKTFRNGDTGGYFERNDSADSFDKEVEKVEKSFNTSKSIVKKESSDE